MNSKDDIISCVMGRMFSYGILQGFSLIVTSVKSFMEAKGYGTIYYEPPWLHLTTHYEADFAHCVPFCYMREYNNYGIALNISQVYMVKFVHMHKKVQWILLHTGNWDEQDIRTR